MKKILHIIKITGISGAEKHLLSLLPELDKKKYDISILFLIEPKDEKNNFLEVFSQNEIKTNAIIIKSDFDLTIIYKLYKFIKKNKFDIVHTHLIHSDIYGALAAKMAKTPFLISTKHNDDPFRKNYFFQKINKVISLFVNKIIVISYYLQKFTEKVEKISSKKIIPIHYGIQIKKNVISNIKKEYKISDNTIILGIIARLVPQKGHIFLLKAFKLVLEKNPDTFLFIIGDGYLKNDLEKLASILKIDSKIVFTGYKENVDEFISSFDIFIHPSLWEGFGLIFLEVMNFGKPIIATKVAAIPEIVIDNETGILVPPENFTDLYSAIIKLINDENLRKKMGEAGKQRLEKYFSREKMIKETEKIYDMLK
ncbi:MAG: glycosyltransferase family 4 protein [bacterium]